MVELNKIVLQQTSSVSVWKEEKQFQRKLQWCMVSVIPLMSINHK